MPQNSDLKYRNFILGLERREQLIEVNGADGRESGKDIKKREALNNWNAISLDEDNMLFYNSYFGIDAGKKITEVNLEEYELERDTFWNTIEFKINEIYLKYSEELTEINSTLTILSTNNMEQKHKEKLIKVKKQVCDYLESLSDHYNDLIPKIKQDVKNAQYASHIYASARRNGEYSEFNFYDQSMQIANEEYVKSLNNCDIDLKAYSRALLDENDLLENAVQDALVYEINEAFDYYRKVNREIYRDAMYNKLSEDSVWRELTSYWGNNKTGLKYKNLIANIIGEKIGHLDIVEDLRKKQYTAQFLNRLNNFLEF